MKATKKHLYLAKEMENNTSWDLFSFVLLYYL